MNPYRVTLAVVLLGLFCTFWISDALAQLHDWNGSRTSPGSIYKRGPNGLPFNVDTGRYVGIGSGAGGGATLKGRYAGSLAGRGLAIESAQLVSGGALARIGGGLARSLGPVGIGMSLAPLLWDEIKGDWFKEDLPDGAGTNDSYPAVTMYRPGSYPDLYYPTPHAACERQMSTSGYCRVVTVGGMVSDIQGQCIKTYSSNEQCSNTYTNTASYFVELRCPYGGVLQDGQCVGATACPSGQIYAPDGSCIDSSGLRPATDSELEDAIYVELVSRGMGSDLARRLINAGYEPQIIGEAGPIELSGPSSVEGGTTSSTTTGPAGTTTTNTTTNYDITYQGDTVTVTETTTVTTTRPDGSTETTTETKTPAPGTDSPAPPQTEQTPFCELYPDASACQPLGSAGDQELNAETRTVELDYTGAAGSCPAPHMMNLQGKSVSFSYGPLCDFAQGIRPLVIALSMLFAGLFLLSVGRSQ